MADFDTKRAGLKEIHLLGLGLKPLSGLDLAANNRITQLDGMAVAHRSGQAGSVEPG